MNTTHILQKDGIDLIAAERQRQLSVEGWTPEHDDSHSGGELALAGACYALNRQCRIEGRAISRFWPWSGHFKPRPDRIRELEIAGALIAAEIDRLLRLKALEGNSVPDGGGSDVTGASLEKPAAATLSEPKPEEKEQRKCPECSGTQFHHARCNGRLKFPLGNEIPIAPKAGDAPPQNASDLNSLRVKVAELLGWNWFKLTNVGERNEHVFLNHGERDLGQFWRDHGAVKVARPENWAVYDISGAPNYPSDLNACAEARRALSEYERDVFAVELIAVVAKRLGRTPNRFELIDASATEQCQAFVTTKELTSKPGGLKLNA